MANINLDIKNIRSCVMNTQDQLDKFSGSVNQFLNMLTNVDTTWNDDNTVVFIKTIGKDKESFANLVNAIKNQISITSSFCDDLESTVSSYFNISTLFNIKYIESSTQRSVELLNDISARINDVKSNISMITIPATSTSANDIKNLLSDVDTLVLSNEIDKINSTVSAINKSIEEARYNSNRFDKYELDTSAMSLNSIIKAPELKRIDHYEEAKAAVANAVAKAELSNVAQPSEIKEVSFNEKIKKEKLDDLQHNGEFTEATFVDKKGVFNFTNKKDENINSNYSFNEKKSDVALGDKEAAKLKEYDYKKKDILARLAENNELDTNKEYQKKDSIFDIGLNNIGQSSTKEYSGPTKDTEKVLFENGNPSVNVSEYNFNESKAQVSGLSDISVNNIKEYSIGDGHVDAALNEVNTTVDDKYSYQDNIGQLNVKGADFNVSSRQYHVNDDNIIE